MKLASRLYHHFIPPSIHIDPRIQTRPDTRPIPDADGWAGAETLVFPLFNLCSPTDQPTDRRTDKASYRVACPQLKSTKSLIFIGVITTLKSIY